MKPLVFESILRGFPEAMVVSLAGVGEPLLHEGFVSVVEDLGKHSMITDVTTNGYFLSGPHQVALSRGEYVREVSVSLNGASAAEHAANTGGVGFSRVLENVRCLVSARERTGRPLRIAVSQVCNAGNVNLWHDYVRLASDLGVDRLYLHNHIEMQVEAPDLRSLSSSSAVESAVAALPARVGNLEVIKPVPIRDPTRASKRCDWFFRNLAFDAVGNVGSCGRVMNPRVEYGSIWSDEDPWNSTYMVQMRRRFLAGSSLLVPTPCRACVENHV